MRTIAAIGLALTLLQSGLAAAPQADLPRYTFTVEIEGKALGTFRTVSGLAVETEVIEYRDGSGGTTTYFPGNTKYTTVKLSRAFTGDSALWEWYTASAREGHVTRVAGTVIVFDRSAHEIARYHFLQGWPSKYTGPTLTAGSNDIPIETIEIVHSGLQLIRPDTRTP
jgi:phage tail-like protein